MSCLFSGCTFEYPTNQIRKVCPCIREFSWDLFVFLQTASFYNDTCIKTGSEAYTSKQCGLCGCLNDKLGASEIFNCENCGLTSDRDVHVARNILLKHLI